MNKECLVLLLPPASLWRQWPQWHRRKSILACVHSRLGELVKGQVADFNASQSDYVVVESTRVIIPKR